MSAGCPSWCVRHSTVGEFGTVHHSSPIRPEPERALSVWLFRLPSGTVQLGIDSLVFDPLAEYASPSATDVATVMRGLGHPAVADAVLELAELARSETAAVTR